MLSLARPLGALVLTMSAVMPVLAQSAAADASSSAPAPADLGLVYRSTFDGYQRFTDEKVNSWRESNDTVGRIGGWRAYANEARQPDPGASPAAPAGKPASAPAPTSDPHSGHGK